MGARVSVLMNCYNGAAYLSEAIESVLAQTYGDWEIIFWDNRSSDESADIFQSYPDGRLLYFLAPEHTNLGRARMLAAAHLTGDWIGFLDCDDVWLPEKLAKQIAAGDADPDVGMVYCRTGIISEGSGIAPRDHVFYKYPDGLPSGRIYNTLIKGNFIALPSMLVRRSALDRIGGFAGEFSIMEDYYVALGISREHKVAAVDEELCRYRVHDANASLRTPLDTFEDLRIVKRFYPDPRAYLATLRIVARHFKKCIHKKRSPHISQLCKMVFTQDRRPSGT